MSSSTLSERSAELLASLSAEQRADLLRRVKENLADDPVPDTPEATLALAERLVSPHAQAVRDDPRSKFEPTCSMCATARKLGLL